MKNKRFLSFIMSLLLIVTTVAPVVVLAEGTEGVKIVSTTYENGSVGVTPMGVSMEVEFNVPMDPASLTTASISSEPAAIVAVVPDKTKTTKCTVYFSALELNTKYKVMFSKQIKSLSGERLNKTNIEFKTSANYPQHHQIVNGDMENTDHLNMFELAGASKTVLSYQKEGTNSILKFNPGWAGAGVGQYVYIEPGKTYEMRAKIKSTSSQMVRMIMSYVSVSEGASNWWHPIVSKTLPADQWVDFSGTVTIPSDLSYDHDRLLRITAQNKGAVIYIDDMQFFETGFDVPMPKTANNEEETLQTFFCAEENGKMEQMVGLGIFEPEMLEKADLKVSRIDAAACIGKIAGVIETTKNPTSFVDLEGVRKSGAAQSLVNMGIMKGYVKYFYPDNNISVQDVLESMVNLLGYEPMAAQTGYGATISKLKLKNGIQAKNGALTYGDFAIILANALDTDVMDEYAVLNGENLLWRALKAEELEGIVTATEYTDIYGVSRAKKGNIVIDDVSYKVAFDPYGLEGKSVKFFTKEINNENFIMYITEGNSLNKVLNLEWDDIEEYSNRRYGEYVYYNENNKMKRVSLAQGKKFIYNGVALNDYSPDDLVVDYGNVQLIDNNNDNLYDIVRVEEFDTYVVSVVNSDSYIIYDENESDEKGKPKTLDLSLAETIIVEENGQKVRFGNIVPGSVVSVAKSKDGSFAKLYVSNSKLESYVGSIHNDGTKTSIALFDDIHGEGASTKVTLHPFYADTKKVMDEEKDTFMGQSVVVAMDHMGYAVSVAFGVGVTNWQWGYVLAKYHHTEPYEDDLELDVFGENGEFSIIPCAEKVKFNNNKPIERREILSYLTGANDKFIPQLIRFKKNANGEIVQIISSDDPEGRLLPLPGSGETLRYFASLKTFGYKIPLSTTSVPLFLVPSDVENAEKYQFVKSTVSEYLSDDNTYTIEAYSIDDNELDAEFVVLRGKTSNSWTIGMVTNIKQSIDENGEILNKVTVQNSGSNYTALVYPDRININNLSGIGNGTTPSGSGLKLKQGDIVMYQNDTKAVVDNMRILYSCNNEKLYTTSNPGGSSSTSAFHAAYGTVMARRGDLISLLPDGKDNVADNYEIYNLSLYSKVLVFDKSKKEPYVGTKADVFNSSKVVVASRWGAATLVAVYK